MKLVPRAVVVALLASAVVLGAVAIGRAQTPVHEPPPGMTCPGDRLVWVNTRSGVYHFEGERYFGSTKQGKFTCQHDADREGDRPTRNGQ